MKSYVFAFLTPMVFLASCGGGPKPASSVVTPGGSKDPNLWPKDDRSMCTWKGKKELEVSETAGPGALKPNIRRVYKSYGRAYKTLLCREIDTNLDGIKDVVRLYNDKGEATREEADRDYNGKIDIWSSFVEGRLVEENEDNNGDGKPDVWKFYNNGQLYRVKRDRNNDGKADVWEIYTNGRLERMGVDANSDGHVDRWDRDEQLRREADEAELRARQAMAQASGESDAGAGDAGASK